MKKLSFLALTLFVLITTEVSSQKYIKSTIKLNAETGEIISGLPTSLTPGDKLDFQLYFHPSYKAREVTNLLDHHFTAYKKISKLIKANTKGILLLKDAKGKIRDYVTYNKSGYRSNKASYTRIPHKNGFKEHPEINSKRYSIGKQAKPSNILISEVIFDPIIASIDADGNGSKNVKDQTIELLNPGTAAISISEWKIFVNGKLRYEVPKKSKLSEEEAKSFHTDFGFSTYQSSIKITVRDNKDNLIDSLQFHLPYQDSYKVGKSLTKSFKNGRIVFKQAFNSFEKDKVDKANMSGHLMPSDVLINEMFIDPAIDLNGNGAINGNDSFIEIANYSTEKRQLNGWTLYNGSTLIHTFIADELLPEGLLTVFGANAPASAVNANPSGLNFSESLFKLADLNDLQTQIKVEINNIMDSGVGSNFVRTDGDWIFDWEKYDRKRDQLMFPDKDTATYADSSVPNFSTRFTRDYELRIIYYDAKGQIVNEEIQPPLTVDLLTLPNSIFTYVNPSPLLDAFAPIDIGNFGAQEIAYELRVINPYFSYLNDKDNQVVQTESYSALSRKPLEKIEKKYSELVNGRKNELSDYDVEQIKIAINRDLKLYELSVQSNPTFNSWLIEWLWFNKGELNINPFNSSSSELKLRNIEKEIKTLQARITASAGAHNLTRLDNGDGYLFKDPVQLESKKKQQGALKGKIKKITSASSRDQLLYKGKLMVSPSNKQINALMRHHDAKNKYVSWTELDTKEVTEDQRLFVLVENEKTSTSTSLVITETAIDTDETRFEEDAAGSQLATVLKMDEIGNKQAYYKTDFSYALPIGVIRDISPNLQTTPIPYQLPTIAPSNVSYTIKAGAKGSEKDVVTGKYRNNKLHRVRLKSGLLYSFLELQSVDTTGNSPTKETRNFGADGTFGFQVYFKRTDIRKIGLKFREKKSIGTFFYLGFSMRNLQENMYLGLGFEPISGVSFLSGLHIGERNKIESLNGEYAVVGEEWKSGMFASIVVDVSVLTRLFGLTSTIPFE